MRRVLLLAWAIFLPMIVIAEGGQPAPAPSPTPIPSLTEHEGYIYGGVVGEDLLICWQYQDPNGFWWNIAERTAYVSYLSVPYHYSRGILIADVCNTPPTGLETVRVRIIGSNSGHQTFPQHTWLEWVETVVWDYHLQ